ncbi:hypothetical protein [Bradyrhizobium sp. USDA 10063]
MPVLTRRRDLDARQESWLIYFGDVHVGTVRRRSGKPTDTDPWQWRCGFYPGSNPGDGASGTAATFVSARAAFEAAWAIFLLKRTEADFEAWRRQHDWTARKYAAWARGENLPSQRPNSVMRCACGAAFDSHDPAESYDHRRHIYAAQQRAAV